MACALAATAVLPLGVVAQIKTDGSLGNAAQTLTGPGYQIPQSLGKLSGSNLFHSFQVFNINTGESVNFSTSTAGIANVISRVTGGSLSQINGLLTLNSPGSTPSFYLINPAGVAFGTGAAVNVPGAFYVSTADYVKFPDGNFQADTVSTSTFSSASPTAFGFLGNNRASVTFLNTGLPSKQIGGPGRAESSVFVNKVGPIGIVAGDVTINNSVVGNESGDVRVVALGKRTQEVSLSGDLPAAYGTLSIIKGGKLVSSTTSASDSGSILVSAGDVMLDQQGATTPSIIGSQPVAESTGNAGSVAISATGELSVLGGATINVSTFGSGDAGSITLNAGNITINGNNVETLIQSETNNRPNRVSSGDAGSIVINTPGTLTLKSGGQLNTSTSGAGDAGSVNIKAGKISIDSSGSQLSTGVIVNVQQGSQGAGGTIDIVSTGLLGIGANGRIAANTYSSGSAGAVSVSAGQLDISGGWISSSAASTGNAGTVKIVAGGATLDGLNAKTGGLGILSESFGTGNAGAVDIAVTGKLDIKNNSSINTSTLGSGKAGSVKVLAGSVSIDGGGNTGIQSSALPNSSGDAGNLDVAVTGGLTIANGSSISSTASGSGNAGTIKLTTGDLSLLTGGQLTSATYSPKGFAGSVTVNTGTLLVDGIKNGSASTISASAGAGSSGQTGTVSVTASGAATLSNGGTMSVQNDAQVANPAALSSTTLSLTAASIIADGAQITASTARNVPASDIKIMSTGNIVLKNGAQIKGTTTGPGDAGLIDVSAAGDLTLSGGAAINGNTSLSGNAAAVNVTAANITLDGNGKPTSIVTGTVPTDPAHMSEATGSGGAVVVTTPGVLKLLNGGQIQSSSATLGNAGSVTVNAGSIMVDNQKGGDILGGIYSTANNQGSSGSIQVKTSGATTIKSRGQISATTYAAGDAGTVSVDAGSLTVADNGWISSDTTGGAGKAGTITVKAGNIDLGSGGKISSTAANAATGNAGSIAVTATGNLTVDGPGSVITTETRTISKGDAGSVVVNVAKDLKVVKGGQISSATSTPSGVAGSVMINTGTLLVDGVQIGRASTISASASKGSSGQTGTVSVTATGAAMVSAGGTLSVQNDATVARPASLSPTTLSLTAASITADGAQITASTSGNVAASDIKVKAGGDILLKNRTVIKGETSGAGDAGLIELSATGNLTLASGSAINGNSSLSGNAAEVNVSAANITLDGSEAPAAILTSTVPGDKSRLSEATGKGGAVGVTTPGALVLLNGGQIQSSSATLGDAGSVTINAGSITVDNNGAGGNQGGIYSTASSQGNSGSIKVKASGDVTLKNKGQINATTFDKGNAGIVEVEAGNLTIASSGWISSDTLGAGKAGTVTVKAGNIGLDSGGKISSTADNAASGAAGSIAVTATGNLTVGSGTAITTATQTRTTGDAGSVVVNVTKDLSVLQGGQISSTTATPQGVAGSVLITTGSLLVDGLVAGRASSISASALPGSSGQTGTVSVSSSGAVMLSHGGTLSVQNDATVAKPASLTPTTLTVTASGITVDAGQMTASTSGNVAGSDIKIKASGDVAIKNGAQIRGATTGAGDAGLIDVGATGSLTLSNGASINGNTSLSGNAGAVNVSAASITLDGNGKATSISTGTVRTDAANPALATGKGGAVVVNTPGALKLLDGGQIQSSSESFGDAGSVTVNSASIMVDNQNGATAQGGIYSTASSQGKSGSIKVKASGDVTLRNQGQINATAFDKGNAGIVEVEAGNLTVASNGWISSDTLGAGNAGTVTVKAGNIGLDSGGKISSLADSTAAGDAGSVAVTATGNLALGIGTAITAATQTKTTGNAGSVVVNVGKDLSVRQGGQISSSTSTPSGAAGSVTINAGTLQVDGMVDGRASSISASAAAGSLGRTGSVEVKADQSIMLSNGGKLSVQNDALVTNPGGLPLSSLQVSAPNITLKDAQITTASTGNVPASRIRVSFSEKLALDPSSITTSSNLGNGGAIDIIGGKMLVLDNSQITTSVAGTAGSGGNINVSTETLLMLTGFVQANTAARNASGGDVSISAKNLVTSGNVLFLGGQTPYSFTPFTFGFNVIQAAAPTGLSGAIKLTSPALDVSASLIGLNAKLIDTGGLGRNPCQSTGGSSLVQTGRGGLPASAVGLLGPQSEQQLAPEKGKALLPGQAQQNSVVWGCK